MKTNLQVAQIFAENEKTGAKGFNMFFEYNTVYSYGHHFAIAKRVEHKGKQAFLFTTRKYSNSTSKHVSLTRCALNKKDLLFCAYPDGTHFKNIQAYKAEAEKIFSEATKGRKGTQKKAFELRNLGGIVNRMSNYIRFFEAIRFQDDLASVNALYIQAQDYNKQ